MTKIQSFIFQIKIQLEWTTRWVAIRLQYLQFLEVKFCAGIIKYHKLPQITDMLDS